jgi:tetratricopeptide (TPR) repeat protein
VVNDKFIVPYQKNEHFTGRRGLLARLCEKLCETAPKQYNHRIALYGLGGVGKTQLALEYVYSHKTVHDRVYWLSGVDQASLLAGFQEIAKRTRCVTDIEDLSPSDVAKLVLSWLNQQEHWILVIDNLDDVAVVEDYLPERSPGGLTLVTTRNPNADEIDAVPFEVGLLDAEDAVELLSLRSKLGGVAETPEGKAEAQKIVEEVGFLPLAIEQAGAYIREASKDIFKFLPSYKNNPKTHHNRVPKGNWKYAKSIATTWRLSFQQVEQNNKAASKLLQLFAFLNPDGILVDFLEAGKEGLDGDLREIINDSDILFEALSELERFSLVQRQVREDGQQITIHRLVQSVIIDDLDEPTRSNIIQQVIQLGLLAFPEPTQLKTKIKTLELSRRYRSQVIPCLQYHDYEAGLSSWHILAARVAGFLHVDGCYEDSAKLSALAIDVRVKVLGPEHPETLQSIYNLASTYRRLARSEEALTLFQKSLDISKRVLGSEHAETLHILNGLAWTYTDLSQYEDASLIHQYALDVKKRTLGSEDPQTLHSMDGLAWAYWRLGRYHEARSLQQETLEISERVHGPEHVDTLSSMDGLGWAQWRLGRYNEAVALFQKSLDVRKKIQGMKHPDTLFTMDGLAWGHWRLGRYKDATFLFQEIVDLNKIVLGPTHPDTVMNMYGLAWGYWRLGRYKDAAELFQITCNATTDALGAHHPDTLLNHNGLAWCYWSFGDYNTALRLHREILERYKQTLGPKHPDMVFSLFGLAWAHWSLGQYQEAANAFQERLEICSESLGPDHRDALMSKNGLAATYEKLGRCDEAVALFLETLEKRREVLAPDHPEVLETMNGLAGAYRSVARYADAIELFQETLGRRTVILGREHPDTLQTLQGLAVCYDAIARYCEAKKLYEEVLRLRIKHLGDEHPDTVRTREALANTINNTGHAGADPNFRDCNPLNVV